MHGLRRMVCLVDGEHYIPVTKAALDTLDSLEHNEVVAVIFIGGTEKLRETSDKAVQVKLGRPVHFGADHHKIPYDLIGEIIEQYNADVVMDLSDEPIVDYSKRFKIATIILEQGINYEGPDFKFYPISEHDVLQKPSLKILGTGKRIGKTAVSAYAARIIDKKEYNPCIVAMGRGGPTEPEIVRGDLIELTPEYLMEQSNKGVHAASDHWEDALMSRILTIGCRRCGGGMVGDVFITNMKKGAQLANEVETEFVIIEGSGAAIPPIKTDKHIVLVGANQPLINIEKFFGPFRIKKADLVVITMCEMPMASPEKVEGIEKFIKIINPGAMVISTVFRPTGSSCGFCWNRRASCSRCFASFTRNATWFAKSGVCASNPRRRVDWWKRCWRPRLRRIRIATCRADGPAISIISGAPKPSNFTSNTTRRGTSPSASPAT